MSANICEFDRASICATCLSQDRQLFSVSEVQACAKFYSEISLTQTDKVCWECHHKVRKIVIFKNRAQQAQAWLRATTNNPPSEIQCLSSLKASPGIFLNIIDPGPTNSYTTLPPLLVKSPSLVKSVKLEAIDEHGDSSDGAHLSVDVDRVKFKEEIEIEVPALEISKPKKRKPPLAAPIIKNEIHTYTEESLTEEAMLEWWKKKKEMAYYTQTKPSERCDQCAQPLGCLQLYKVHAQKHTELYGDFECNICKQRMVDERELELHKQRHYRILKCQYCEFAWDDANTMRKHSSELHGIAQTVWDCDLCSKQLPSARLFSKHLRIHILTKCPDCGKSYTKENIKRHMIQHQGGKPLRECAECGASVRGEDGLRAHVNRMHRNEADPEAYCKECKLQFRDMITFRGHFKSKRHATESDYRYSCEECSTRFVKLASLQRHMTVHTDVRFPCDQCGQSYTTNKKLKEHVKWKHEGRERPRDKLCDYCGRGFADKRGLAEHMNTHTGARPFVCKLCGADFGQKAALYLHGRYKHKLPRKNPKRD